MQPDDLSLPRGDNKIKEKLNLHVKKRLQETGKSSTAVAAEPPTPPPSSSSSSSSSGPSTAAAASAPPPLPGPSPGSKTKKQKTKHSPSSVTSSSTASLNLSGGSSSSSSKPPTVPAEHLMLSPGALGGGNSNDTTNSSFNSVDLDADANLSNDGQDRGTGDKSSPGGTGKTAPKADIFTLILNEKKSSLMRDPEVIKFLRDLVEKRDKS